jgi:ferritin-like metal-binding protein YciE
MNSLRELYVEALQDLYDAEQQITRALPKMAQAASHPDLRAGFEEHLIQTQEQIQRLEQIFQELGQSPGGHTCKGVQGLIQEGEEMIRRGGDPDTLDAFLIGAAQKVEHYEIAGYGTARTWATLLGEDKAAKLLQTTADEEGTTDKKLTGLAMSHINRDAMEPGRAAA